MEYEFKKIKKHIDERGYLVEFLKNSEILNGFKEFGQIYYVTFDKEGIIRGNHYHIHKHEWFGVVFGKVQIDIEDISTKERKSFIINSDEDSFTRLGIGPSVAHAVKSLSGYAILIDYFTGEYNRENPDSFKYKVF